MLSRIFPDRFVPVLFATILLASLLPVRGAAVPIAQNISTAAILLLFFLNGVRLPRDEVLHGIRNWRLQGGNLLYSFGAMALIGLAAQAATAPLLTPCPRWRSASSSSASCRRPSCRRPRPAAWRAAMSRPASSRRRC
ncbi:MAG TPA: bile acid:sodium symporter [Sphingopyxis sp.]|uniref:bile acid:sodium symporter n=1 Tax=Sphingopyxis sp. TaxID=1908224 RepID=UPI002E3138F1|nr:bile acid:sodium symporter [Sphingopyxis sp.]HEX2812644.1 bile acid:sodium symporter [Sphingopyxis sp.]